MRNLSPLTCTLTLALLFLGSTEAWSNEPAAIDYIRDVRPILHDHCVKCHGAEKREGGLRLDVKKLVFHGGDSGKVIDLEKPGESELVYRVETDDKDDIMPPKGKHLTAAQIDVLKKWIAQGAVWPDGVDDVEEVPDFWSFLPVSSPALPDRPEDHPIDKFVRFRLAAEKLAPSPKADRNTLLRRLSLDLTGLPPSPEIQKAFEADNSPEAFGRMADQLLASPHFGEKWAMSWLDSARYADSDGYEKDTPRPHAWRWRDWVIDAINRDLPFDEFTVQQLAGDLLPGATELVQQGTGFHRNTLTNREGGVDAEEFRVKAVIDRTNTTFSVWMGLTVGCAECHSHKYDPLSQREYYQLFSFFNSTNEKDLKTDAPPADMAMYEEALAEHEKKASELEAKLEAERPKIVERQKVWEARQLQLLQDRWKPLESVRTTQAGDNILELTGKAPPGKMTALRIKPEGKAREDATVRFLEAEAKSASANGSLWLESAVAPGILDPNTDEGWKLSWSDPDNSLVLTTGLPPTEGGWLGNSLKTGSQDGATALLNVYYGSPVPGRGTVGKIKVFTNAGNGSTFTVFLLRPDGEKLDVVQMKQFTSDGTKGEREFDLGAQWEVVRGDVFAHWGNGGPTFVGGKGDTIYYPMGKKPKEGDKLEVAKFKSIPSRDYAFQFEYLPVEVPAGKQFAKPEWGPDGAQLTIRLQWKAKAPEVSFKVEVTDDPNPAQGTAEGLDADILKILSSKEREEGEARKLYDFYLTQDLEGQKLKKALDDHLKKKPKKPEALLHVMAEGGSRKTQVHLRGNFRDKGSSVESGTPTFLPGLKVRGDPADRLDLARWIVSPDNPLTSRVAVNQIWAELFGQGLVRTPDDFGTQGEPPSHPELLDWLATEFQRLGWSRKKLIKLIVLSDTYQQASQSSGELNSKDPENRLLARQNRFRLQAELVRDQFLASAGLLNPQIGGPSFRPPLPDSVTRVQFINKWTPDKGDDLLRRGMYIHLQRNLMLPMLMTFDRPEAILSCTRRERSNTPLQALTLLNSTIFVEAAREMAKALLGNAGAEDAERLEELFRRVVARPPSDFERKRVLMLLDQVSGMYAKDDAGAKELLKDGIGGVDPAKAAAWIVACRTVLNLDEVITRE